MSGGGTPPSPPAAAPASAFEPRLPDVAQWFADRSLPYTHHLEAALLSSEFGITSLEEMKVIQMIEWKDLLQHDPLSSEGYGLVKWRVFQEEFRKFAAEEFDGTKKSEVQQRQKKAKNNGVSVCASMSSVNRRGKTALRKMKSGADLTGSAVLNSMVTAGVHMRAAVIVAKSKSQRQLQQIKMLQNGGGDGSMKKESRNNINNNNNKSVSNTMASSTMNSFLANDGAAAGLKKSKPTSTSQRHVHNVQMDIDVVADLDNEFAPKQDDYRATTAPSSAVPPKVHPNSDEQDDVSTINMSSYEQSTEDDNDNDTVLTLDEQKWNVRYADLLRYYKLHGTTHISLKANATKPRHIMLRRWADRQRKAFLHDQLTEEQIEKLVAVQFDFGQDIEELVAEQIEQERIQAEQRRMEKLRLKADAERRRLEAEKRRLEAIVLQKEMDKKRIESTYVVADVEGCVEAIYVS